MKRGRPKKKLAPSYDLAVGEDGWAIDPNHPINRPGPCLAEIERASGAFPLGYLKSLEAGWLDGNPEAANRAMQICRKYSIPPPPWLEAAVQQLVDWHVSPPKKRQGRKREDAKHFRRWDAITTLRDNFGLTLHQALERAVEVFEDTPDAGGFDAMQTSYKVIQRAIRMKDTARFLI